MKNFIYMNKMKRMKATLKYGTSLHMCKNGYFKTLSTSKKKDRFAACHMGRLGCRGATHPATKPSIFFHHLVQDKKKCPFLKAKNVQKR